MLVVPVTLRTARERKKKFTRCALYSTSAHYGFYPYFVARALRGTARKLEAPSKRTPQAEARLDVDTAFVRAFPGPTAPYHRLTPRRGQIHPGPLLWPCDNPTR